MPRSPKGKVEVSFPVRCKVRIGICRKEGCKNYGTIGPLRTQCPGNHSFKTRSSNHIFEPIQSDDDKCIANGSRLGKKIGVCNDQKCFSIGYPGKVCSNCIECGKYNKHVYLHEQNMLKVYVKEYTEGASVRKIEPFKRVHPEPPIQSVNVPDENEVEVEDVSSNDNNESIVSNLSF